MTHRCMTLITQRRIELPLCLTALLLGTIAPATADWTQYGGPNQSFTADSTGLSAKWPADGPPKLWTRGLGEGYSAILADAERLYTMYRAGVNEIAICLDAKTGDTIWEYLYVSMPPEGHIADYGNGPNSTPLLTGGKLYTIGVAGIMHCLDGRDGTVLWSHDLLNEFGGTVLEYGYSSSPIEYKDTVIVPVGGRNQSIVAFDKQNGRVVWKNHSFVNSYSTPRVIQVDGADHLVIYMASELIGADPATGELKWQYPIRNIFDQNITMPMPTHENTLFFSSLDAGGHSIKLSRRGDEIDFREVWSTRKINFFYVTTVQIGDYIYGSTGRPGTTFIAAINAKTGKTAWRKRGFTRANVVCADGYLIVLDDSGQLALTTANPEGLTVHSKVKLLQQPAWTVPTIVGRTMYLRDRVKIMALDLSAEAASQGG